MRYKSIHNIKQTTEIEDERERHTTQKLQPFLEYLICCFFCFCLFVCFVFFCCFFFLHTCQSLRVLLRRECEPTCWDRGVHTLRPHTQHRPGNSTRNSCDSRTSHQAPSPNSLSMGCTFLHNCRTRDNGNNLSHEEATQSRNIWGVARCLSMRKTRVDLFAHQPEMVLS